MIDDKEPVMIKPWYRGFKGKIIKLNNNVFRTCGTISDYLNETTIKITELPILTWTEKYNSWLETLIADDKKNPKRGQILDSIKNDSGNNTISFTKKFLPGILQKLIKNDSLEKTLKLYKNVSTTNMHLYGANGVIKKYITVLDIFKDFYNERLNIYEKRKIHYLRILENNLNLLKYKIKFLKYVITGKIVIMKNKKAVSKDVILKKVESLKFPKLSNNAFADDINLTYSYLTSIKFFDLTPEEMAKLEDDYAKVLAEYEEYKNTPIKVIWLRELNELEEAYNKWLKDQDDYDGTKKKGKRGKKVKKVGGKKKKLKVKA